LIENKLVSVFFFFALSLTTAEARRCT